MASLSETQEPSRVFILNQLTEKLDEVIASAEVMEIAELLELAEGGIRKKFSLVCGKLRRAIEHAFIRKLKPKSLFEEAWVQLLMASAIEELHISVNFDYDDQVLTDKLHLPIYSHLRCYVRLSHHYLIASCLKFVLN